MSISSHAELVAAIASFAIRSDTAALAPDYILLCEAELNRRLRVRHMVQRSTATIDAAFSAVPADFLGPIAFKIDDKPMKYVTPDKAHEAYSETAGRPIYYTTVGAEFRYLPTPDQSYTAELSYWKKIPALASGPNWLISLYPDTYLYGALRHLGVRQMDDRLPAWEAAFERCIQAIEAADRLETGETITPIPCGLVV